MKIEVEPAIRLALTLAAPWIVASPTFMTYDVSGPGLQIVLVC
jgi:hypothetical protein